MIRQCAHSPCQPLAQLLRGEKWPAFSSNGVSLLSKRRYLCSLRMKQAKPWVPQAGTTVPICIAWPRGLICYILNFLLFQAYQTLGNRCSQRCKYISCIFLMIFPSSQCLHFWHEVSPEWMDVMIMGSLLRVLQGKAWSYQQKIVICNGDCNSEILIPSIMNRWRIVLK